MADLSGTGGFSVLVPFSSPSAKNGTSSTDLIWHFQRHWAEIFHMPHSHEIISLSKTNSLVRNTILAITACHLRHVSPGILQHRIAEHFQQSLALQDYQRALDTPRKELGQSGINALLLSAVLLNMLAFALPESGTASDELDPSTSWVFSPREDRLGWLALQAGLRPLLISMVAYLDKARSFLSSIFLGSEEESWPFPGVGRGLEVVPEIWIKVFGLDGAGGSDCETAGSADAVDAPDNQNRAAGRANPGDVFRSPVTALVQLRDLEPVRLNVFKNLYFLGKVQSEFRALLYDRDERALWLFGYWLGLMCRFKVVWWCDKRVRRDYKAIRMWLEQLHLTERPGIEGEMWTELMEEFQMAPVFVRM